MSASLRFLAVAVIGWAGLRAASLGMLPDAEAFTLGNEAPKTASAHSTAPPIVQTEFPPIEPPSPMPPPQALTGYPQLAAMPGPNGSMVPIYYYPVSAPPQARFYPASLPTPRPAKLTPLPPMPAPLFYSPIPQLDEWPLSRMASASMPARRSATASPQQSVAQTLNRDRIDRLQLTAWALLRGEPGPASLATGGTLGGSQAGARFAYNFSRELALSLRTSAPVGGAQGGEVAAGIRLVPLRSLPLAMTFERRQALGSGWGGRSGFAAFVEGCVYDRPMPWDFRLDGYAQAGVVGIRSRDWFADGGFTLTRPVFGQFSAGIGVWGGAQPGIYRVDTGPRLSMKVRNNMRVHLDWRQRLVGNAQPGSGPAVTLAGDF